MSNEYRPKFTSSLGFAAQLGTIIRYENGIANIYEDLQMNWNFFG